MATGHDQVRQVGNRWLTPVLVTANIAAIATANLAAYHWGPKVTPYTAFLLIGLDLTSRDRLQDTMRTHRRLKMLALICSGSLVAFLANPDAGRIALASGIAFGVASAADWALYARLRKDGKPWLVRSNGANLLGAGLDSILFTSIAFGQFLWPIIFAQFCAKVAGGMLWSLLLSRGADVTPRYDRAS